MAQWTGWLGLAELKLAQRKRRRLRNGVFFRGEGDFFFSSPSLEMVDLGTSAPSAFDHRFFSHFCLKKNFFFRTQTFNCSLRGLVGTGPLRVSPSGFFPLYESQKTFPIPVEKTPRLAVVDGSSPGFYKAPFLILGIFPRLNYPSLAAGSLGSATLKSKSKGLFFFFFLYGGQLSPPKSPLPFWIEGALTRWCGPAEGAYRSRLVLSLFSCGFQSEKVFFLFEETLRPFTKDGLQAFPGFSRMDFNTFPFDKRFF